MDIKDQVVVVTGGGAGIGAALARAAAKKEAQTVIVADINGDKAKSVATDIGGESFRVDVSKEDEITALVENVEKRHGPIGLFCSNAGFVTSTGLEDTNERILNMWEVHVMAHIYAARAVLPQMIANEGGHAVTKALSVGVVAGRLLRLPELRLRARQEAQARRVARRPIGVIVVPHHIGSEVEGVRRGDERHERRRRPVAQRKHAGHLAS